MRYFLFTTIACCLALQMFAQTPIEADSTIVAVKQITIFDKIAEPDSTQGSIVFMQDERIQQLVETHIAQNQLGDGKISGWRVQIYNSSNTESRKRAQEMRKKFVENYPEYAAYMIYQPPFFKIRVGDFRTREEAFILLKKIITDFPVSYLVKDAIVLPKL